MPTATLIVSPLASRIRDADTRARIVESAQASIVRRGIADIRVVVSGDHAEIRAAAAESVGRGDARSSLLLHVKAKRLGGKDWPPMRVTPRMLVPTKNPTRST